MGRPAAERAARQRADRPTAARQLQAAMAVVMSATHATARPPAVGAAAMVAALPRAPDAAERPRQVAAAVVGAQHAEALPPLEVVAAVEGAVPPVLDAAPLPRAEAAVGEPVARHVAPARPLAVEAAAHAEEVPEAAAPADAEVRPLGAAAEVAVRRDAAERPAVAEVAPDGAAPQPEAAGVRVDAEVGQPGAQEAGREPGPGAGRPSGAAWVCHRDRPRPAAVRPGRGRQARPAQTRRCLQWTSR